MFYTYEGVLDGNQLDWVGEGPAAGTKKRVYVTILAPIEEPLDEKRQRGKAMRAALGNLAAIDQSSKRTTTNS